MTQQNVDIQRGSEIPTVSLESRNAVETNYIPKVSVIVPVYKVEKYLPECIESILSQTFTDFELILVDDGSPDNSGKICDDYATRDSRVRVFHKENGGVTSARRLGVENARSEWVMFVDGDDYILPTALSILVPIGEDEMVDIVEGELIPFKDGCSPDMGGDYKDNFLKIQASSYARELGRCTWIAGPVAKIYRRTLLTPWVMSVPKVFSFGEDLLMNLRAAVLVSTLVVKISKPFYFYRIWNMSTTRSIKRSESYWIPFLVEVKEILSRSSWENRNTIFAWHAFRILKILIVSGEEITRDFWVSAITPISSLKFGLLPVFVKMSLHVRGEWFLRKIHVFTNKSK